MVGIRGTCGWVRVDEGEMAVYIIEGTVTCSVSDPDSGEEKTAAVSGGEMARPDVAGTPRADRGTVPRGHARACVGTACRANLRTGCGTHRGTNFRADGGTLRGTCGDARTRACTNAGAHP